MQAQIDDNMRTFIQSYMNLDEAEKITIGVAVPRMPFTRIRFEDFAKVDEIRTFLIQDLWFKPVENLSNLENEAVVEVGLELFGT